MISKTIVVGGGSAGFLAAITLKRRLPNLDVLVIRSKELGIIGVGEGSTIVLPQHLHGYLGVDMREFFAIAKPVWKLGIRFLWGTRPFFDYVFNRQLDTRYTLTAYDAAHFIDDGPWDYAGLTSALMTHDKVFARTQNGLPVIEANVAYHIENVDFVTFLEAFAARAGVRVLDDTIAHVQQDDHGVSGLALASGRTESAGLYVDCSGFFALLLGKTFNEPFVSFKSSLLCDRAVVGGWTREHEPIKPYTTCETMDAGWCWQIEHEHRINRGYVYSSDFISDTDAEAELRRKNPRVGPTRIVKFVSGRYDRTWVKNVVAIGNASGFVEPLESTSLAAISSESQWLAETIAESAGNPTATLRKAFIHATARTWDTIRQFLAVHYRFNRRLDTPFWTACRETVDLCEAADIVDHYVENGPTNLWHKALFDPYDQFGMEGYLSMFLGMQVPTKVRFAPPPPEREKWQRIQQALRNKAPAGLDVREALAIVRHPQWQWPNLYNAWAPKSPPGFLPMSVNPIT
jgi:tryptophan 7-halogenase